MSEFKVDSFASSGKGLELSDLSQLTGTRERERQDINDSELRQYGYALNLKLNNLNDDYDLKLSGIELKNLNPAGSSATFCDKLDENCLLDIEKQLYANFSESESGPVAALIRQASECSLSFKQECVGSLGDKPQLKQLSLLYKSAGSPSQQAFVDLCAAYVLTSGLKTDLEQASLSSVKDETFRQIQNELVRFVAADAKSTAAALNSVNTLLLKTLGADKRGEQAVSSLKNILSALAEQKQQAAESVRLAAQNSSEQVANLKKLNVSKLTLSQLGFEENAGAEGIPAQCGLYGVIHDGGEIQELYQTCQHNQQQLEELRVFNQEIDGILKERNLRGYTIDQLLFKVHNSGMDNQSILDKLQAHSKASFDALGDTVVTLVANPGSGANLGVMLSSISTTLRRDLCAEHSRLISRIISNNLARIPLNINGLKENLQLKTLQNLMSRISSSPELQQHFSDLMDLLNQNSFNFSDFAVLGGYKTGDESSFMNCAVKVIENYIKALNDPDYGLEFVEGLAKVKSSEILSNSALKSMLIPLGQNGHELLTHKCSFYMELGLVKEAVILDLANLTLDFEGSAQSTREEQTALKQALERVASEQADTISEQDLKLILDAAVNGQLKNCNLIWNSILHSAYHLNMSGQLEQGSISQAPAQVFSKSISQASPQEHKDALSSGQLVRDTFVSSLSPMVQERLQQSASGLQRTKEQQHDVSDVTDRLNSMAQNGYMNNLFTANTTAGKRLLALTEMKKELSFIRGKAFSGGEQFKEISSEDELLCVAINRQDIITDLNSTQMGASRQYVELMKQKDQLIINPAISRLTELQNLAPGEKPKGEEVAASLILLRDNLIDSLDALDETRLQALGLNKSTCVLSQAELDYGIRLNLNRALNNVAQTSGKQLVNGLDLEAERVAAFNDRADKALTELREKLAELVQQKPLTKLARLVLRQYVQTMNARYGESYATFLSTITTGNAYLKDHDVNDPRELVKAQALDAEQAVELCQDLLQVNSKLGGPLPEKVRGVEDLILNDLCSQLNLEAEDKEVLMQALEEPRLSDGEKKQLISALSIRQQNVNPETMLTSDPRYSETTAFSRGLRELESLEGEDFRLRLNDFIREELTSERLNSADALLVHLKADDLSLAEGTLSDSSLQLALGREALSDPKLEGIVSSFKQNYETRLARAQNELANLNQSESEQINKISKELLGKSSVRGLMRLSGSYAAVKLGYSGYSEVFSTYASSRTSPKQKLEIVSTMVKALCERGLEHKLATMLVKARLNQSTFSHIFARTFSLLRNKFFSMVDSVRNTFKGFFASAEQKKAKYINDFETCLPMIQEVVHGVGKDEVRYMDGHKNLSVYLIDDYDVLSFSNKDAIQLSLRQLKDAGFFLRRDEHNRIQLDIKASTLYGVNFSVLSDTLTALRGDSISVEAGHARGKILNLNFDSEEKASVFICKMLLGKLESEDVRLAQELSSGSEHHTQAKAAVEFSILGGGQSDHSREIWDLSPQQNPLVADLVDKTNYEKFEAGLSYSRESTSSVDKSGSLYETRSRFAFNSNFLIFGSDPEEEQPAAASLSDKARAMCSEYDKKRETVLSEFDSESMVNSNINSQVIKHMDTVHQVHTSCFGYIDRASDITSSPDLTYGHLQELQRLGILNQPQLQQLRRASKQGLIHNVSMEYRLKQSVIDRYKQDPSQLAIEAKNIRDNYEFSEFKAEIGDYEISDESFDGLSIASLGLISYTQGATFSGKHIMSIKPNVL
ncbi:MAG: hypothetical protein K6F05_01535 [Succinivibrio sp.]|nr:hypothetical protein [Succinivibrio sp.]